LSSNPRPVIKAPHLRRVTPETKFVIDYGWWDESKMDLKTYLYTRLSLGEEFSNELNVDHVDLIDNRTGEVRQVDAFQYLVQAFYGRQTGDFVSQGTLVDAVFSVLMANGNQPMSILEISDRVHRPIDLLIRTFGGSTIYHGIRPLFDED
jgi:hypothetical protein